MTIEKPHESSYRIGAVARLTGVNVDTLRIWERRYQVVTPQRSEGGSRLYCEADIERLVLIKRLVDAGHAIGTVAGLTHEQLKARGAGGHDVDAMVARDGPPSIVIVGTTLPYKLTASMNRDDVDDEIEIAGTFETLASYEAAANKTKADALVGDSFFDNGTKTVEGAAHDKQDVPGVYRAFLPFAGFAEPFNLLDHGNGIMGNFQVNVGFFHGL